MNSSQQSFQSMHIIFNAKKNNKKHMQNRFRNSMNQMVNNSARQFEIIT